MSTSVYAARATIGADDHPATAAACGRLEFVPAHQYSSAERHRSTLFVDTQNTAHPFQLPQWASDDDAAFAVVRDSSGLRLFARCGIVWPLGRRFEHLRALTITRGPVCDDTELMRVSLLQLVEMCRSRNFVYVDINPDVADADAGWLQEWLQQNGWFAAGPARASLRLDLRPDSQSIQATFRKTTRYEIRKAERAGVAVRAAWDEPSCRQFLDLYFAMAREKAFAPDREEHLSRVLTWLRQNGDRGVLLFASQHNEVIGGVVAIRAGRRCWYVWGATRKQGDVSAGHLLQWHALTWGKQQGCTEYDLGGYREGATDGPALFKRGFSENVVRFLPSYRYVINSAAYSAIKLARGGLEAARMLRGRWQHR